VQAVQSRGTIWPIKFNGGAFVAAVNKGFTHIGTPVKEDYNVATQMQRARAAGAGHRSSTYKRPLSLISEFSTVTTLPIDKVDSKRHKVLRTKVSGGTDGAEAHIIGEGDAVVGVLREAEDFILQAKLAKHPVDDTNAVPQDVHDNVKWILSEGPVKVAAARVAALRNILKILI
jgi:hypothetical protein